MPVSAGIMAVDEQKLRISLHQRLEASLGTDEAALLMDYLPPVGWADIARRSDIDTIRVEMAALRSDVRSELRAEIANLKSSLLMWMIPTLLASVALGVTLARLTA
jgi:hypothetical protein